MNLRSLIFYTAVAVIAIAIIEIGESQDRDPIAALSEGQRRALSEPFVGVTADGHVLEGLYPLRRTGLSTETTRDAMVSAS